MDRHKLIKWINKLQPKILGVVSPIWFLLTILGLNHMATDHIFDHLYGAGSWTAHIFTFLAWFMSAEMLVNWIFLCTVKSLYRNNRENINKRLEYERTNPNLTSEGVEYSELMAKCGTDSKRPTNNWSVITHYTSDGQVKRMAYPYWGWKPCVVCCCHKPPRCHHCPICDVCVLKRDHHCFFAMQCVGLNNQRFFFVFNFWAVLLTLFAIPQLSYYIYVTIWPELSWSQLILPWTAIIYILGHIDLYKLALVFQMWSLSFFILLSSSFLHEQWQCINGGMVSFELDQKDRRVVTKHMSRRERFACIFGRRYTWLNLVVPLHWWSSPTEDGILWHSVKLD